MNNLDSPMTTAEAAERILWSLWEQERKSDSSGGIGDITGAAAEVGVFDPKLIQRAADHLDELGLLENYMGTTGPRWIGSLSSRGVRLLETTPSGGKALDRLARQAEPSNAHHYHAPVIQGIHGSNVAIDSPNAKQSITANADLTRVVDSLIEALKRDDSLPAERRDEAVADARTLKEELEKRQPNSKVVKSALGWLSISALAGQYVAQIKTALGY